MKKIILVLCGVLVTTGVFGVTLCKKSNTAVAVLNKSVAGTISAQSGHRWVVNMNDGTVVKGKSLCSGTPGTFAVVNTGVADTYDTGLNCYCKMMAPATSYWVNATGETPYASESACESACVGSCASYMATNTTFRSAVYDAVW